MSVGAHDVDSKQLASRVAATLAAAEIPPSKLGAARGAGLSEAERELYFWILNHFATHGGPTGLKLSAAAVQLGLDIESALETLAHQDLVPFRRQRGALAGRAPRGGRHLDFDAGGGRRASRLRRRSYRALTRHARQRNKSRR